MTVSGISLPTEIRESLSRVYLCSHTHVHVHTYIRAYMHATLHIFIYTYTQIYTFLREYIHINVFIHKNEERRKFSWSLNFLRQFRRFVRPCSVHLTCGGQTSVADHYIVDVNK